MRILVAEDEKDLNRVIVKELIKNHYSVDACYDGQEALDYIRCAEYDAIILDIMMPIMSGTEVVHALRKEKNPVPILFLTAKDSIEDRVAGLDIGADDYLVKPFAFDELLARIRAMIRRNSGNPDHCLTEANLKVDCNTRCVYRDNIEIELSNKEFAILEYLIRNKGIVLSRERIEQHVWNYDYEGGSNVVDVYIRYLRKKIDDAYEPKLIHTIRGSGYVLKVKD
ncbi:response regulator transcription factor [Dorea acetigenes]|jgi:two-component system copper resistance phosphate regulon response regulator CusR|uniref:Stage 0 sporulation protein A homolog n=1 Tax=Dorea acetigenes TaxID=2981787 RepID=A0ABT2RJN8_9FIRM|nr:response regulator transcription factor [Dorea acetigenes]MCU6685612.1 response regulator transcription factor [Dorea acetigenes]SCI57344.1 Transcriptional activator protein CopR [uncultured Clostridium sp.]